VELFTWMRSGGPERLRDVSETEAAQTLWSDTWIDLSRRQARRVARQASADSKWRIQLTRFKGDDIVPLGLTAEAADRSRARRLNVRLVAGGLVGAAAFLGFWSSRCRRCPRHARCWLPHATCRQVRRYTEPT
jgi:hypothetical protein